MRMLKNSCSSVDVASGVCGRGWQQPPGQLGRGVLLLCLIQSRVDPLPSTSTSSQSRFQRARKDLVELFFKARFADHEQRCRFEVAEFLGACTQMLFLRRSAEAADDAADQSLLVLLARLIDPDGRSDGDASPRCCAGLASRLDVDLAVGILGDQGDRCPRASPTQFDKDVVVPSRSRRRE